MIETKDLRMIVKLLDEKIDALVQLKDSLICKESDLEQRLGKCQNEEAKFVKLNFQQAKVIESLAYNIIGNKDRKFIDGLLAFMSSYDL